MGTNPILSPRYKHKRPPLYGALQRHLSHPSTSDSQFVHLQAASSRTTWHGMRKGLKKPKSSLPPAASASTSKLTTSGGSTKKTTTAGKAHPKSSKGKGKAPAPAPVVAPPINYDVIEALERPAKLVQLDRQLANVRKAIRGASRGRGTANLAGTEKKGKSFAGGSSGSKSGQSGGKTRSSASAKKGK